MSFQTMPELLEEEKAMPLSRFYYQYPMHDLYPLEQQILRKGPMDTKDAIPVEHFTDLYKPVGEYDETEMGYCMFEDGSGYVATYTQIPPTIEMKKVYWYLKWVNIHPKNSVFGHGNLRYKIWNQADHWDHNFMNWTDGSDGICTMESLDLGEGMRKVRMYRHNYDLRKFGLTEERIQQLTDSGYKVKTTAGWETFDEPGAHLCLAQIRPCPFGGYERRSREWIGWRPTEDGKLIREPRTECTEEYLRMVVVHTCTEWEHLLTFVNDLYEEYASQPIDAD